MPIKPEVMSPAGYYPQLHAGIEAGADAVYFGLKHFTARAKVGFAQSELPDVMQTLHARGVKGYVTFNTLVFDHELCDAVKTAFRNYFSGQVDATGLEARLSKWVPQGTTEGSFFVPLDYLKMPTMD